MVHGSARDEKEIVVASGMVMPRSAARLARRHRRQDHSVCLNKLPVLGRHAGYRAGLASDGAFPCLGDELPAAFDEVLDQKLDEAWQIDPSLARIPDGASVRNGCRIDTRSVSANLVTTK